MSIKSAIYRIRNTSNNKVYIGSALDFNHRWSMHKSLLKKGTHHSPHLQNAWNLLGESHFAFEVIEEVECVDDLINREQYWIDFYQSYKKENGYNVLPSASSWLGMKHSSESKMKISEKGKGRKMSDALRERIKTANSKKHPAWRSEMKKGSGNPNAKLTDSDVADIKRQLRLSSEYGILSKIARKYSVSPNCIWEIKTGKKWAHIN